MVNNIKSLALFCLILFLAVSLVVAIMAIWDVIDNSVAKDMLIKIAYTFGAIFAVSAVVAMIKK
ncbi:MAG: hypothetical protein WA103_04805 [Minisyncoccales bacterium]